MIREIIKVDPIDGSTGIHPLYFCSKYSFYMNRIILAIFLCLSLTVPVALAQTNKKTVEAYKRGEEFQKASRDQETIEQYDKAISLGPNLIFAYENRASLRSARGDMAGGAAGSLVLETRQHGCSCA